MLPWTVFGPTLELGLLTYRVACRLTNSIMMNGRNNGKKLMAVRIVAHTFEIVRFLRSFSDLTEPSF